MEPSKEHGNESDSTGQSDMPPAGAVISNTQVTVVDGKPVFKPTRSFLLAFSALLVLALAISFDATSLSVGLPIISIELGGTALEAFWSGTGFLLASTVLQPTFAGLSHIFGRKYLIYIAIVFFAVGSIVAAVARSFTVILVGRSIQGIGGGGLLSLTEVVITDLVPLAFRAQWFSLMSAVWAVGTVTGPLIGAGFAQNVSWRWIFWINLPIIGVGGILVVIFLNQARIPGGIVTKLKRFDWIGAALFTASSTVFLFGITAGGVLWPWGSYQVLLPLLLGAVALVGTAFYEAKYAVEPLIDRRIFGNRDIVLAYIMSVFHSAILWALTYFLTLYYQGVKQYTAVNSAVAVLPETLTVAPAAMVVGIIAGNSGRYRWALWSGWIITTLGAGILMLLAPESSVPQWVFLNLPIGLGTGMLFTGMALAIQAASPPELNAHAAAFFSFLRTFGQSIGVAVAGAIFQNVFRQKLEALPAFAALAEEYSRDATSVVGVIVNMPDTPDKADLIKAYNEGLRIVFAALLAFSAFCMILSIFIKGYTLNQEHVTQQALVQAEKKQKEKPEPEP